MTTDLDELQAVLNQAVPPIRVPAARDTHLTPLGRALIGELITTFASEGPTTFMVKLFDEPILPPADFDELAAAARPTRDASVPEPSSTGQVETDGDECSPIGQPLLGPNEAPPCQH